MGIGVLPNMQRLQISRCPELEEMPSLAGLLSLTEFQIWGCPKMQKLEGLQHLKLLETVKADTCWKAPGIESFQQMVRLRRLELVAGNRLALQPCIQIQIEKWPCEMTVCGRAADNVCFTFDSFTFPGLSLINLVESGPVDDYLKQKIFWGLDCPKTHMFNASIICFIIRCGRGDVPVYINAGKLLFSMEIEGEHGWS